MRNRTRTPSRISYIQWSSLLTEPAGSVESGEVRDAAWFVGTDTIRVIRPHLVASPDSTLPADSRGKHLFFQNARNPAVGGTTILLDLPTETRVSLRIFNAAGAVVKNLVAGPLPAGRHNIAWTGRAERGEKLAPGVYFCVLKVGDYSVTRKVLLVR